MKTTFAESLHFTNFTLAWTRTSERGAQSIFQSHTQIFKERSNQRLEINIHRASTECSFLNSNNETAVSGGAKRDRTVDLLRARQALSQLSYGPVGVLQAFPTQKLVGLGRFELPTSPLSGVRSNQLSYRPNFGLFLSSSSMNQAIRVGTCEEAESSIKEVIQPQVPLRLPCYDFTPVMNHTVVTVLPKVRLATSGATHSHGVTGGVYKARERIHRDILIRDY